MHGGRKYKKSYFLPDNKYTLFYYRAKSNSLILCCLSALVKKHYSMKNFRIAILLRTPQQRRRAKLANALDRFQKKEKKIMFEEYDKKIPDYYPTMYMDGYTPD